jgi:Xaa-Pro aminopeptidase
MMAMPFLSLYLFITSLQWRSFISLTKEEKHLNKREVFDLMKLRQFQSYLQEKKIDAAIFLSLDMEPNPNFYYFTKYSGHGCLVIPKSSSPYMLVSKMEEERAKKGAIKHVFPLQKKRLFETLKEHLGNTKILGVDEGAMTLLASKNMKKHIKSKIIDVSEEMDNMRMIKTSEEIQNLKKSCYYADKILQTTIENFKDFNTESDVAAFLQYETFRIGLDTSFKPIVASGKNGSMPHYQPKNIKLNKGLCVIDFGVKYNGYCSDITRTISIGNPSYEQKNTYEKLWSIQQNTINEVKEGKNLGEVYDYVVKELKNDAPYFTHGLGHGIGVEIHEAPNLTLGSKDKVCNNMAFTIEPGVYFKGKFGIRIEDSVLFDRKPTPLTKTTKELIIV